MSSPTDLILFEKPTEVANLAANIQQKLTDAYVLVNISWQSPSDCKIRKFQYSYIANTGERINGSTSERNAIIHWAEYCAPIHFLVWGETRDGQGDILQKNITLAKIPNVPVNPKANLNKENREWSITWEDTSECQYSPAHLYVVNVYDLKAERVLQKNVTQKSIQLTGIDPCREFLARIITVGISGQSGESKSVVLHDPQGNADDHLQALFMHYQALSYVPKTNLKNCPFLDFDAPPDILIKTLHKETRISVTWGSEKVCEDTKYEVSLFNDAVPGQSSNVRANPIANESQVEILWDYEGDCLYPDFLLSAYTSNGSFVKSVSTSAKNGRNELLYRLPQCVPLKVGVQARNPMGSSSEAKSAEFTIPAVPSPPKAIRVVRDKTAPRGTISWEYEGECSALKFRVEIYKTDETLINSWDVTGLSTALPTLPTCVPLIIGVSGSNEIGFGAQERSSEFTIPPGPSQPKNLEVQLQTNPPGPSFKMRCLIVADFDVPSNIRIVPLHNETQILIMWKDTRTCRGTKYDVSLYDEAGAVLQKSQYDKSPGRLTGLQTCVPLFVTMRRSGIQWVGTESDKIKVEILDIPVLPKAVKVEVSTEKTAADVSWSYDGACAATRFLVEVYSSNKSLQTSVTVNGLAAEITGLPLCVDWFVSVQGQNEFGSGPKTKNSKFTIPAVPKKPTNVSVDVQHRKKTIRVTWDDASECSAEKYDVIVHAQRTPTVYSTSKKVLVLDWLASCVAYTLRVAGVNKHGKSALSNTVELLIPQDFSAPTNVKVEPKHKQSQITVKWDFEKSCDNTTFEVSLYDFSPPRNIKIKPNHTESQIMVTWEKNRDCSSTQYEISIYDTNGDLVNRTLFDDSPGEITQLPKRAIMFLTIRPRSPWWLGDESDKKEFHLHDFPTGPANILVKPKAGTSNVSVSWEYESEFNVTNFVVTVYGTERLPVKSVKTRKQEIEISELPVCVSLEVGVLAQNEVGDGPEGKSSQFTISEVPEAPQHLRIQTMSNVARVTVIWEYQGTCALATFRVSLYNANGTSLRTVDTNDRRTELIDVPLCVPLLVGVLGRNDVGSGQEQTSSEFTIAAVPNPPKSIRTITVPNQAVVTIFWDYLGECETTDFQVSVYRANGSFLKSSNTSARSAEIAGLPLCVPLLVGVQGYNLVGLGPQVNSSTFTINAAPSLPNSIRAIPVQNSKVANFLWEYDGACQANTFRVSVYTTEKTLVKMLDTNSRNAEIGELPMCVPLLVTVQGQNQFGLGSQPTGSEFTIPGSPSLPKSVRAVPLANAASVNVSWKYDGPCAPADFRVSVQKPDGPPLKFSDTHDRAVEIADLPMCVPLLAGVLARNKFGSGEQKSSSTFTIDAVPNPPSSIRTITTPNTPSATVLWEYSGVCPIVDFNVSVHKTDGQLLKSFTGTSRSAEFANLPLCLPLYVTVQGRNQLGAGLQTNGSVFTIEGIPNAPNLVSVTVTPNVTRATVSWTYDGTCTTSDFVVNVYKLGGPSLMTLNAIERSIEISPLPVCVELVVGVLGNNKIGPGPQKNSSGFSIASVPSAPKSVQATIVSNAPTVTASWDYDGACPNTNFRVSVYKPGGASLKTLESSDRRAVIDDLPTCTPLLLGVLGVNQIGSGQQTNSSTFTVDA
ncbi:titin, partial [Clonorchis sinensis]